MSLKLIFLNYTSNWLVFIGLLILLGNCTESHSTHNKGTDAAKLYSAEESEVIDNTSELQPATDDSCQFEDGTYTATVYYNNPETEYSATYTLDVEVQGCQVIQINFPTGGHLDESHISAADIDSEGNAMIEGEDGKTYDVQINN